MGGLPHNNTDRQDWSDESFYFILEIMFYNFNGKLPELQTKYRLLGTKFLNKFLLIWVLNITKSGDLKK